MTHSQAYTGVSTSSNARIGIFLPGLYDGGAQRAMLNLASGFISHGYAVDLVLAEAEGPFMSQVPASVRLVELNKKHRSSRRALYSLPALIKYIRTEKPAGIVSSLNYTNIIAVWAKLLAGVPFRLVLSEQNTFSVEITQFPYYARWIFQKFMKFTYPRADVITTVSAGVADDLAKTLKIPRDRVTVIFNPIITPELQQKKEQPIENPWFVDNHTPVILAMGRLTKQKGFDILIRAFGEVKKQRSARLMILGEGEDRQAMTTLIKETGLEEDVSLPGYVSNPYPYMKNAAMFVLSSRWEGLPTVLAEALSCGIPLVATDCPSGPREILRGGMYGQLVPVGDAKALADAIIAGLDGKLPSPAPESWKNYELNEVTEQYIRVLVDN